MTWILAFLMLVGAFMFTSLGLANIADKKATWRWRLIALACLIIGALCVGAFHHFITPGLMLVGLVKVPMPPKVFIPTGTYARINISKGYYAGAFLACFPSACLIMEPYESKLNRQR